jgi:hypothetical protein
MADLNLRPQQGHQERLPEQMGVGSRNPRLEIRAIHSPFGEVACGATANAVIGGVALSIVDTVYSVPGVVTGQICVRIGDRRRCATIGAVPLKQSPGLLLCERPFKVADFCGVSSVRVKGVDVRTLAGYSRPACRTAPARRKAPNIPIGRAFNLVSTVAYRGPDDIPMLFPFRLFEDRKASKASSAKIARAILPIPVPADYRAHLPSVKKLSCGLEYTA